MDATANADDENIDDILNADIEEPEETDDDVTYDAEEEEPAVMKAIRIPVHPLTDIPEPSSDIEVTYKFLTGERFSGGVMRRGFPYCGADSCDCESEEQWCCCVQYYGLHGIAERRQQLRHLPSECESGGGE